MVKFGQRVDHQGKPIWPAIEAKRYFDMMVIHIGSLQAIIEQTWHVLYKIDLESQR